MPHHSYIDEIEPELFSIKGLKVIACNELINFSLISLSSAFKSIKLRG